MPARRLIDGCIFCGQILKWIPVLFITVVIVWSYYAYVIQLCFLFSDNIVQQIFYFTVYHVLVTMLFWTYWKTIFTTPGAVPKQFKLLPADIERLEQAETQDAQKNILETLARDLPVITRTPYGVRFCEKCAHVKPDRCHHCSVCGRCVLKMDHHCPWVNNCVGYTNYKFFILFLGYALTYCLFIALTALPFFIRFWRNELEGNGRFHILFLFFVALMFAISLACLFGYHIYLVLHNRTTLEAFRAPIFPNGPDKDGFNMGAYTNFVEVFGDKKSFWFLPISNSRGDGLTYPCRFLPSVSNSNTNTNTTTTNTVPPVPNYHSMDPIVNTTVVVPIDSKDVDQANLGDGVSFPQRHMAEDEDSLLGERQRWMEEGGGQDTMVQPNSNAYRVVDLSPVMAPV